MNPFVSTNRLFGPLFIDNQVEVRFSTEQTLEDFRAFETALVSAQGATGRISPSQVDACLAAFKTFQPDVDAISAALILDGLPVPEYVRQLKAHVGVQNADAVHLNVTSQDLIDTSLALACRDINQVLDVRLSDVIAGFDALANRLGQRTLMGRTRMQAALPITVAHRIGTWRQTMAQAQAALTHVRPQIEVLQLGGPVGRYGDEADAQSHINQMSAALGLMATDEPWHTNRQRIASYANVLSQVTGGLGKFGMDITLMSQQGIDTVRMAGGGTSSAMPHKQNPVHAELLVAIARYNAGQLGLVHQALVHEQERSGTAWALEWMTLPAMMSAAARSLWLADQLIAAIKDMGDPDQTS